MLFRRNEKSLGPSGESGPLGLLSVRGQSFSHALEHHLVLRRPLPGHEPRPPAPKARGDRLERLGATLVNELDPTIDFTLSCVELPPCALGRRSQAAG